MDGWGRLLRASTTVAGTLALAGGLLHGTPGTGAPGISGAQGISGTRTAPGIPGSGGVRARTWLVDARAAVDARGPGHRRALGGEAAPFATLQEGLDAAGPGDVVRVAPGEYTGPVHTVRDGAPGLPVRVEGEPGAVLRGEAVDEDRLLSITHDWVTVRGLEITNADKGVWIQGASHVVLRGNHIHHTGGECVRLKYHATRNEVVDNTIEGCGLVNFDLSANRKNGEGVYIGTAPEQLAGHNPTPEPDTSDRNWVHDNVITAPSECVEVKEAARQNLVERNMCSGGLDPKGGALASRGNHTVFRGNIVYGYVGKGVRLGGDTPDQGLYNDVRDNTLLHTGGHAVGVMRLPQGRICGNVLRDNLAGAATPRDVVPDVPCP